MAITHRDLGFSSQEELDAWVDTLMGSGPSMEELGSVDDSHIIFRDVPKFEDRPMRPGVISSRSNGK